MVESVVEIDEGGDGEVFVGRGGGAGGIEELCGAVDAGGEGGAGVDGGEDGGGGGDDLLHVLVNDAGRRRGRGSG